MNRPQKENNISYYIKIFGCQMNQSDAEKISAILQKLGLKEVEADSPAEALAKAGLIVFVTCGVRQSAEDRVYGQINNIRKKYPKKKIILTGCLAHRKDVQRRLKGKVDLFTSIQNFANIIPSVIARSKATKQPRPMREKTGLLRYARNDNGDYLKIIPRYSSPYTTYVPVMTGCNNYCSYCVVPYARGREYSRPAEDILKEVKDLVKNGCKEIILLGQNVNSYYCCHSERSEAKSRNLQDLANHKPLDYSQRSLDCARDDKLIVTFPKLLKLIEKIPGHFWLTFLTSHPKDMSDKLIEIIAKSNKICKYISLPAQSGDNEILRKMNRKYTIAHYKTLIEKIRSAYKGSTLGDPDVTSGEKRSNLGLKLPPAISTDIIVGFPGETKKQFENTAKLLRETKFDMAYTNQYSPRPETLAWKMKDNVSKKEKVRREKVLTEILKKTALENNKKYIERTIEVLVEKRFDLEESADEAEEKVEPWTERYLSHTRTQKKVIFFSNLAYRQAGKKIPVGSFQKVKITKAKAFGLEGEMK